MWLRIILVLILTKFSEETCRELRKFAFHQFYTYLSCTNITPNDDLNGIILSKMTPYIDDLLVSNSSIPELSQEMFLNMRFNNITIKSGVEIIQSETFKNLNITSLILDYNDIKKIKDMSFNSPFIKTLSLQNNSLSEIKVNNFQGLSGLQKLSLRYNTIADIEEDSFNPLTNLEELDLSFNKLVELHFGLFEITTSLQIIYLNNNLLKTLSDHIFSQCKALKNINIENNFITTIDARHYPSSLRSINASNNQLISVDFSSLVNLSTINLNFNNLKSVTDSLYNLTSLKNLYINYNSLGHSIDTKTFHHLKNLIELDLDGNGLQTIDFKMLNISTLKLVSLTGNDLTDLEFSSLNPLLATLKLNNNSLNEIGNLSKLYRGYLKHLDLSYNDLEEIGYDMFGEMHGLVHLWLQYNSIRFLRMGCFRHLYNLQKLNLSHNRITNIEVGTFAGLSVVFSLDISYNDLSHLDENIFHNTNSLRILNISNNHLSDVDVRKIRRHTPYLNDLILIGNNVTCQDLIDTLGKNGYIARVRYYNVSNVYGIPCTSGDNRPTNKTWNSANFSKYLDSIEGYEKQISWNISVITVALISLLALFCLKFTFPRCWSCYTATKQFLYKRYRNEQEMQLM